MARKLPAPAFCLSFNRNGDRRLRSTDPFAKDDAIDCHNGKKSERKDEPTTHEKKTQRNTAPAMTAEGKKKKTEDQHKRDPCEKQEDIEQGQCIACSGACRIEHRQRTAASSERRC